MKLDAQVFITQELKTSLGLEDNELTVIVDSDEVESDKDAVKSWVCCDLEERFNCAIYPDQFKIANLNDIIADLYLLNDFE